MLVLKPFIVLGLNSSLMNSEMEAGLCHCVFTLKPLVLLEDEMLMSFPYQTS